MISMDGALKISVCVCIQKLDFSGIEPEIRTFEEKFGKRILVKCNDLAFNLQSCVAENEEGPTTNVIHNILVNEQYLTILVTDLN